MSAKRHTEAPEGANSQRGDTDPLANQSLLDMDHSLTLLTTAFEHAADRVEDMRLSKAYDVGAKHPNTGLTPIGDAVLDLQEAVREAQSLIRRLDRLVEHERAERGV